MKRMVSALLVAAAFVLSTPTPAAAHADVVATHPEAGVRSDAPPDHVMVRFDGPVRLPPSDAIVVLRDGQRIHTGPPQLHEGDTVLHATLHGERAPGDYKVEYRTLSEDDHLESGSYSFTVTQPVIASSPTFPAAAGTATPAETPSNSTQAAADGGSAPVVALTSPTTIASLAAAPAPAPPLEPLGMSLRRPLLLALIAAIGAAAVATLRLRHAEGQSIRTRAAQGGV